MRRRKGDIRRLKANCMSVVGCRCFAAQVPEVTVEHCREEQEIHPEYHRDRFKKERFKMAYDEEIKYLEIHSKNPKFDFSLNLK